MTFGERKVNLVQQAEAILGMAESEKGILEVLREYNRWYTGAKEFITYNSKGRLQELETIHEANQTILTDANPDLHVFKTKISIQIGIIEGATHKRII